MIDDRLLDMLESSNAETRKQAVKRLAQTKNRAALPYLADVYRNDADPEVRDLARKGGVYIQRNAPEESQADSLYDPDEDDIVEEVAPDAMPLPSEIYVSPAQQEKAAGLVQQALDIHMRGDNDKAAEMIHRALRADPHRMHDSYTISLAATVTGLPGPQAIQMLAPTGQELQKRKTAKSGSGGSANRPGGLQAILAYVMLVAAVIVLVGFFLFPWFDIGNLESPTSFDGETLREEWNNELEEINVALDEFEQLGRDLGADVPIPEEFSQMQSVINAIHWDLSGLNTTLFTTGIIDHLEAFGLNALMDGDGLLSIAFQTAEAQAEIDRLIQPLPADPLDYALFLVPVGGLLSLIIAVLLLMRSSMLLWGVQIAIGLITVLPMAYFFTTGEANLRGKMLWGDFMELMMPEQSLLASGFWVSLLGGLALVILPFVAVISTPAQETAPAADRLE